MLSEAMMIYIIYFGTRLFTTFLGVCFWNLLVTELQAPHFYFPIKAYPIFLLTLLISCFTYNKE